MRRRAGTVIAFALALGCVIAPSAFAAKDTTTWLCKPGLADNPCKPGFDTTTISPTGEVGASQSVKPDRKPAADCFYVYPTVSDDKSRNADLSIDPEERSIALYQAARYTLHCRVFAPMYRQITLQTLFSGQPVTTEERDLAYGDVVSAWKTYLAKYNDGRGVILIGHSQGTFVLRQLIHDYVDPKKSVRNRLISAILLGGNVLVKQGSNVGGDFNHIPACESPKQTGCAVAFSTFNAPVPANAVFGRPSSALSSLPTAGNEVLCTNPASLGNSNSAQLHTVFPSEPFAPGTTIGAATNAVGVPRPSVSTPWVQSDAYTGACSSADDAHVLQISPVGGAPTLNPVPDATWGLHLVDANIALGNLTQLIVRETKAYLKG
ncbi:MAG: hypothetical protein QOI10_3071 [Solirubrobacterales bacterium]|jgi:hypothetical protein|nr:hypothetical protein [Solirubrobacterales bacterium]